MLEGELLGAEQEGAFDRGRLPARRRPRADQVGIAEAGSGGGSTPSRRAAASSRARIDAQSAAKAKAAPSAQPRRSDWARVGERGALGEDRGLAAGAAGRARDRAGGDREPGRDRRARRPSPRRPPPARRGRPARRCESRHDRRCRDGGRGARTGNGSRRQGCAPHRGRVRAIRGEIGMGGAAMLGDAGEQQRPGAGAACRLDRS